MMPTARIATLALATCGALGSAILYAQALPDAATILDRYVEVTGGHAAYEMHRTEILTGVIEFPAQGLKGKLARYVAPDQEYSSVDLEGIGSIEAGISGGVAWEKSVLLGPRIKEGEEKDQAIRDAYFDAPIYWRQIYSKASTAGIKNINGEDCYEVVLTPATGKPERQFYSQKTGLLVRTTAVAAQPDGRCRRGSGRHRLQKFRGRLDPHAVQATRGEPEIEYHGGTGPRQRNHSAGTVRTGQPMSPLCSGNPPTLQLSTNRLLNNSLNDRIGPLIYIRGSVCSCFGGSYLC